MIFPQPLPPGTDTHVISQLGNSTYVQSAVHFNAGVSLTSADGFGTPTCISYSFWFDMASYDVTHHNTDFWFFNIQNHDNSDSFGYGITGQDDWAAAGQFFNWWAGDSESNFIAWNLPPNYGSTNLINNQWHHILCTVRSDGQVVLYIDDQRIGFPPQTGSETWPEGTTFDLAGIMSIPLVNSGQDFDMADVWIAPGVDLTDDNGLIPVATRRQFVSDQCQPVDPSNWPTSAVQFYGDKDHFITNHGTGGDFTLTGVLANSSAGASPGARVQIDGLKGGIYNIAAYAADWTNSAAYALTPTYGYNVGQHQFTSNEIIWIANPAGSMVIQKYGPATPDIAITRIHTTLPGTEQPYIINGITDDTPFQFAGGCGYLGTVLSVICADWNSSSVDFQMLQPNGQWINMQTISSDSSIGITLAAGTYRFHGAASLAAPLYGTISPINIHSDSNISFVGITEVTDPFSLSGGATGLAGSSADNSGELQLFALLPDGSQQAHFVPNNQAFLPYLSNATYVIDPTNLTDPLTVSITGMPLKPTDTRALVLTDETPFALQGSALEYQIGLSCADWNSATLTLQYQLPDGTWVDVNAGSITATANGIVWPTSGAGLYRFNGASDLNAPLYIAIANTPCVSTDNVSFSNLTSTEEFQLQGGQYMLSFASHGNSTSQWHLNFQAPDGTWLTVASNGDTAGANSWQWYATGRYQIDASSMDNGVDISIASLPL